MAAAMTLLTTAMCLLMLSTSMHMRLLRSAVVLRRRLCMNRVIRVLLLRRSVGTGDGISCRVVLLRVTGVLYLRGRRSPVTLVRDRDLLSRRAIRQPAASSDVADVVDVDVVVDHFAVEHVFVDDHRIDVAVDVS